MQRPPSLVTLHGIAYLHEWVQVKEKNYSSRTPCLVNVCLKCHPCDTPKPEGLVNNKSTRGIPVGFG